MAINSSTKKVVTKKLLKVISTKAQTTLLIDETHGLDKILDVHGICAVSTSEIMGEVLLLGLKTTFNVVFLNKEKQFDSEKTVVESQDKISVASVERAYAVPTIKNITYKKGAGGTVNLIALIEVMIYGSVVEEITPITAHNDGFIEKLEKLSIQDIESFASESFVVSEESEVTEKIDKILFETAVVKQNKISVFDGFVRVEGEVEREITYLNGETIKNITKLCSFVEELAQLGVKADSKVDCNLCVASYDVDVSYVEEQNKTLLTINTNIIANLCSFRSDEVEVVTDLFASDKEITVASECFNNTRYDKSVKIVEKFGVAVDVSDMRRMDEVMFVGDCVFCPSAMSIDQDVLAIKGNVLLNIVYKNYDIEDVLATKLEVPVDINFGFQSYSANHTYEIMSKIHCIGYKNKAGKETFLNFELIADIVSEEKQYECYISDVTIGDSVPNPNHSIVIYLPKENESVFDVAKELRVAPEIILAQNPQFCENQKNNKVVVFLKNK